VYSIRIRPNVKTDVVVKLDEAEAEHANAQHQRQSGQDDEEVPPHCWAFYQRRMKKPPLIK